MATKVLANPATYKMIRSLGKAMGRGIKAHRQSRVNRGKRVAGQRIRNLLLQSGVNLPVKRRMNQVESGGQTVTAVPTRYAVATGAANQGAVTIRRTDAAIPVISAVDASVLTNRRKIIPLYASSPLVCPTAAITSDTYAFYRFKSILWSFRPNRSTSTDGEIAVGFVPTKHAAEMITDLQGCVQSAAGYRFSCYSTNVTGRFISPKLLNMQFYQQGYRVKNNSEVDISDSTAVQGYMVIITGGGEAEGTSWGSLQVSYSLELLHPRPPEPAINTEFYQYTGEGDESPAVFFDNLIVAEADRYPNRQYLLNDTDSTIGIRGRNAANWLLNIHGTGTLSSSFISSFVGTNCTVYPYRASDSATACDYALIVAPHRADHDVTFDFGLSSTWDDIFISCTALRVILPELTTTA